MRPSLAGSPLPFPTYPQSALCVTSIDVGLVTRAIVRSIVTGTRASDFAYRRADSSVFETGP
jgi:hypothetical protein